MTTNLEQAIKVFRENEFAAYTKAVGELLGTKHIEVEKFKMKNGAVAKAGEPHVVAAVAPAPEGRDVADEKTEDKPAIDAPSHEVADKPKLTPKQESALIKKAAAEEAVKKEEELQKLLLNDLTKLTNDVLNNIAKVGRLPAEFKGGINLQVDRFIAKSKQIESTFKNDIDFFTAFKDMVIKFTNLIIKFCTFGHSPEFFKPSVERRAVNAVQDLRDKLVAFQDKLTGGKDPKKTTPAHWFNEVHIDASAAPAPESTKGKDASDPEPLVTAAPAPK